MCIDNNLKKKNRIKKFTKQRASIFDKRNVKFHHFKIDLFYRLNVNDLFNLIINFTKNVQLYIYKCYLVQIEQTKQKLFIVISK